MPKTIEELLDESLEKEINKLVTEIKAKAKILTPRELKLLNKKLINELVKRHKFTLKKDILKYYNNARSKILKKLNRTLDFTAIDEEAVKLLRSSKVISTIYKNMDTRLTKKINFTIKNAIKMGAIDLNALIGEIKVIQGQEYSSADRISRTEHSVITNIASRNTYQYLDDESGLVGKYRWIVANDIRVSPWCKKIAEMTKKGVTLKEMEDIIERYGDKSLKYRRPLQIHIRCRSTLQPI